MQSKFILCLTSVASILGKACGKGIYHTPKAESFATVNIQVGYPVNTTTPDGIVGMFPVLSGNITGKFTGRLVPSLSSTTERILNSSPSSGVFSNVETEWIFETPDKGHIFAKMTGLTTYQNNALHGFGRATMHTELEEFYWANWATFLIEWQADFFTGTAEFEFFKLTSGGRLDGKPIPALLPPGKA